jgi:L-rhamnose mutarotase
MKRRRYCLTLDLKDDPELIREYRRHHQAVWPEVTDSLRQAGILDLELYLLDTRLVMILEVEDRFSFAEKAEIDRGNPKVREWEHLMWNFQKPLPRAKPGEKWILMESIYKFEAKV